MAQKTPKSDNVYIQQVLDAEEEGKKIILEAQERRIEALKRANTEAAVEAKKFQEDEIKRLEEAAAKRAEADAKSTSLQEETQRHLEAMQRDYSYHKNQVCEFLMKTIQKVELTLDPVRKRAIEENKFQA